MPLEALLDQFLQDKRLRNLYDCDQQRQYIHLAVIIKRGKILASATNRNGSRSSGSGYSDRSIHAERNVVKLLGNIHDLRGASMYVMRMPRILPNTPTVKFKPSEPCEECKIFLNKCKREYGLHQVFFTGRSAAGTESQCGLTAGFTGEK